MKIYLIGMPGVGKTSIGMSLAKQLNYPFYDTDNYIEEKKQLAIPEIFSTLGEKAFRKFEKEALVDLNMDDAIISTGGGIIKDRTNKSLMCGLIVWIDCSMSKLEENIASSEIERPLLKTKTLEELYNERISLYQYFHDIRVENIGIDQTVKKIIDEMKGKQ